MTRGRTADFRSDARAGRGSFTYLVAAFDLSAGASACGQGRPTAGLFCHKLASKAPRTVKAVNLHDDNLKKA